MCLSVACLNENYDVKHNCHSLSWWPTVDMVFIGGLECM